MTSTQQWIISIMLLITSITSVTSITGCEDKNKAVTEELPTSETSIFNYFPMAVGSSWEYRLSPNGDMVVSKITGTKKLIGHDYVTLVTAFPNDPPFEQLFRSTESGVKFYVKDANTDFIREIKPYLAKLFPSSDVKVITPPLELLYMPYPLEVGGNWTFARIETIIERQREKLHLTITETGRVVDKETITVPAGNFETFKIEFQESSEARLGNDIEKFPSEVTAIDWFAENVGLIQFTSGDQTAQLVKYHIPK